MARPASVTQRVLERMDAMIAETDDEGHPVAYGKIAGVVVTGNEDGAHHVISEVMGALIDIGFTVPAQAWILEPRSWTRQELFRGRLRPRLVPDHRRNRRAESRHRREGAGGDSAPGPDLGIDV
jgi:hypothetical protein